MEDIVIIGYSDNNGLIFKDILGAGEILESALILDVNTINQTLLVLEHPLIRNFIGLLKDLTDKKAKKEQIDAIIGKLGELKNAL
jgi:hypothetical protein